MRIIKIQRAFKIKLAKIKAANMRTSRDLNNFAQFLKNNHPKETNPKVHKLLEDLGRYDYTPIPYEYVDRQMKKMAILANESKYEGQWDLSGKFRDGMGVQIWPDGTYFKVKSHIYYRLRV